MRSVATPVLFFCCCCCLFLGDVLWMFGARFDGGRGWLGGLRLMDNEPLGQDEDDARAQY